MSTVNGASSPTSGVIEQLSALVEEGEREQADLRAKLDAVGERLRPVKRALAALTDEPKTTAKATPGSGKTGRNDWEITPEKVEEVFARFVEAGEPRSPSQVARMRPGLSPAAAQKAITVLRQQGRLRLVGKIRGGGRTYAVIAHPDDDHQPPVATGVWGPGGGER